MRLRSELMGVRVGGWEPFPAASGMGVRAGADVLAGTGDGTGVGAAAGATADDAAGSDETFCAVSEAGADRTATG